jgi:hypothetical protein
MAEPMDENAKASWGVAEPRGRLGGAQAVNDEGPQGFILLMGGVRRLQEPAGQR